MAALEAGTAPGTAIEIRSLPFIAASPDVHFFRFGNELVAELGMGDGDDGLSPLPGGQAL